MDGQVFVSSPMPRAASQSWAHSVRGHGSRLRRTGLAEGLAEWVNEIAGLRGLRWAAREPAAAQRGDC